MSQMPKHKMGDNTPCDNNERCDDFREEYEEYVKTKPNTIVPEGFRGQWNFPNDPNNTMRDTEHMLDYAEGPQEWRDYHALYTIMFGELLDSGFDWGRNEWPCIDEETRERLISEIEMHYRFREICEAPPARFKNFMVRKLNEIMPKYNKMYAILKADRFDILEVEQSYNKDRNVFSEYPQSQLSGSADYASNADDREHAGKKTGPVIDLLNEYAEKYVAIDERVVKELEVCFWSMTSGTINAY